MTRQEVCDVSEDDKFDYSEKIESNNIGQDRPDIQLQPEDERILQKASAGSDSSMKVVPLPGDVTGFAGTDFWTRENKDFASQRIFANAFKSTLQEIKSNLPN